MNLVHHLVVAESLREKLQWPRTLRGAILLGAIAPDAHAQRPGLGRGRFHPPQGTDPVPFILKLIKLECLHSAQGRAFAASCIAHVVADEITRPLNYHLPPHAPGGFLPVPEGDRQSADIINIEGIMRSLMRAKVPCMLGPIGSREIGAHKWLVLGRFPFTESWRHALVVEPLASLARHCADEALMRMYSSDAGARLLGAWRA